jgi:hypothetical protein
VSERTLRPRPTKALILTAVFALPGAIDVLILGPYHLGTQLNTLFWGIPCLICASQLWPSAAYLKLERGGFQVREFFRQWSCAWPDVVTFQSVRTFGASEMVVFKLTPGLGSRVAAPVASRWLNGWDGRLPDTYGLTAQSLASLLNEYRLKSGAAQQGVEADEAR